MKDQHKLPSAKGDTKSHPNKRVSEKVRIAVREHVQRGASRSEAARIAGLTENSFYKALRLPHVRALVRREFTELREFGPARAWHNIARMADEAASEHVKLDANKWIAGVDGLAPVKNVNVNAKVSHAFAGYDYGEEPRAGTITVDQSIDDAEIIDD